MKRALYININTMWGSLLGCTIHESKKQNKTNKTKSLDLYICHYNDVTPL